MNELLELQKQGFYISLTLMPDGWFSSYVTRWDGKQPGQISEARSFDEIITKTKELADAIIRNKSANT